MIYEAKTYQGGILFQLQVAARVKNKLCNLPLHLSAPLCPHTWRRLLGTTAVLSLLGWESLRYGDRERGI